jgi:hypothetical protein
MNELYVRLDVRAAGSDIIWFEGLCRHHFAKLLAQPFLNRDREQVTDRLRGTDANGFVRRGDRRAEITTRRLEARERRSFACAMQADQGFEEESVSQLPRLGAQPANRECLLEGLSNLWFVLLLDPDQHKRRITSLERALGSFHDWAIEAVTVCKRASRRERKESDSYCHGYQA